MTLDNSSASTSFNYFSKHDTLDDPLATRSVPGSRRNSNDGKSLFQSAFKPYHDDPIDFLMKPPPRSFSIDVGSIHSLNTKNYASGLLFDEQDTASFHPHDISKPTHEDNRLNSSSLFMSLEMNRFETNLRKSSTRSVESLRSKSWAQFLDYQQGPLDNEVQAAFYGQPIRRSSHGGWSPPSRVSNKIATSYSYSDIQYSPFNPIDVCQQYGYCVKEKCTCSFNSYYHSPLALVKPEPLSKKTSIEDIKYSSAHLGDFQGRLYDLCKDQNGCRFLQTKLEESAAYVQMVYQEIHLHFVDLMTDPFGNYLCQKILEKCNNEQRTAIVDIITPEFLKICLNMHGTRAVQKLIEFLSNPKQIKAVTVALAPNVVTLIKDLNGNHVIQKCLYKLNSEHNQFIYDSVSKHCIEVASHKHGCCVYQRCIDYASPVQKLQLVQVITKHALTLVKDPFGNYVVQYVLGLKDICSDELVCKFIQSVCELSVQKFSSNVIEKCIRVAKKETRRRLIDGIISHPNMDRFLRDSYANYVIQTCLDCAEKDQSEQFVERIRPLLPSIRNTPYGKRIYGKIYNKSLPLKMSHLNN